MASSQSLADDMSASDKKHSTSVEWCALDAVRQACSKEHEGPESLGAHMQVHKSHVSRVLNGESPLRVGFILRLPVWVKKRIAKFWCEYYGFVVIEPAADQETAMRQALAGLIGLEKLKMAKATTESAASARKVSA